MLFLFWILFFIKNIAHDRNFPKSGIVAKMADQRQNELITDQEEQPQPGPVGTSWNSKINKFPQMDVDKIIDGIYIFCHAKKVKKGMIVVNI